MVQVIVKTQVFKEQKYYSFQNQDPQKCDVNIIS